jgi:hypothetical protein
MMHINIIELPDTDKTDGFNHTKVSITCFTESELQAVRFIAMQADTLVDISTGIECSSETRANIGYLVNSLFIKLSNFDAYYELKKGGVKNSTDIGRLYRRKKDACAYWLVDKVPYGAKMGIGGVFKQSEGVPVMEMDNLSDDELQDLIVELSGYFNDIKI